MVGQVPGELASVKVITTLPQVSDAVAVPVKLVVIWPQAVFVSGGHVIEGNVVSTLQVYTTVLLVVLLHASVAVTVKVLVFVQPTRESAKVMFVVTALQVSVEVTCAATLATVGGVAGLQPRLLPVGTVRLGRFVSIVQVTSCEQELVLLQLSTAV